MGSQRVGHNLATKQQQKGLGAGKRGNNWLMVRELPFRVLKKVWNYTAATLHDIANVLELCPLKMVKMVNFMLCLSYHNNFFFRSYKQEHFVYTQTGLDAGSAN